MQPRPRAETSSPSRPSLRIDSESTAPNRTPGISRALAQSERRRAADSIYEFARPPRKDPAIPSTSSIIEPSRLRSSRGVSIAMMPPARSGAGVGGIRGVCVPRQPSHDHGRDERKHLLQDADSDTGPFGGALSDLTADVLAAEQVSEDAVAVLRGGWITQQTRVLEIPLVTPDVRARGGPAARLRSTCSAAGRRRAPARARRERTASFRRETELAAQLPDRSSVLRVQRSSRRMFMRSSAIVGRSGMRRPSHGSYPETDFRTWCG